ncbi:MAG: hypothetical protein EOP06_01435 [Proteobacteria bacterium]|nr:MAG: hypothetical protein EOP06_01435 [Pseudomonadota bacterium]
MVRSLLVFLILFIGSFAGAEVIEIPLSFNSADSTQLSGTLTLPDRMVGKKYPCVLLLPGSGPTDRDGNQTPSLMVDLLKQVAQSYAAAGIASFRFDKRAAHVNQLKWPTNPSKLPEFFSWKNHINDVEAAYHAFNAQPQIDVKRLAILGHSEGGLLALVSAVQLRPKALILIGTAGRTLGDVLTEQISNLLDQQQATPQVKAEYLKKNREIQDFISKNGSVPDGVPPGLKALFPKSAVLFLRDVLKLDPKPYAKRFSGSVLVMNGEMDKQVSPDKDAKLLYSMLSARRNLKQELFVVPKASHNLKPVSSALEAGITGPISDEAKSKLATWTTGSL